MKYLFSRLLAGLLVIALNFSCTQESPTPRLSIEQILKKANEAKARKSVSPDNAIAGSWKVLATHDSNGNPNSVDNNVCYADVVWNLGTPATSPSTWQVLNYSGSGCGLASSCDAQSLTFPDWIVNSAYSSSKFFYSYSLGDGINRAYFEETSDCSTKREFSATWTIVDNYYLVIYPSYGGQDIILARI